MRIISGEYKGRRINPPKNLPVRPTKDMAKEALFNILNNRYYFDEITVLDLFSGTGSIAYEFASRGAKNITAVDKSYDCVKFIDKTSEDFEMPITAIKSDVYNYLQKSSAKFDLIFADPPYGFALEEFEAIPSLVFENDLLNENGSLIIEHSKHTDLSKMVHYEESRNYGGSVFSFFVRKEL